MFSRCFHFFVTAPEDQDGRTGDVRQGWYLHSHGSEAAPQRHRQFERACTLLDVLYNRTYGIAHSDPQCFIIVPVKAIARSHPDSRFYPVPRCYTTICRSVKFITHRIYYYFFPLSPFLFYRVGDIHKCPPSVVMKRFGKTCILYANIALFTPNLWVIGVCRRDLSSNEPFFSVFGDVFFRRKNALVPRTEIRILQKLFIPGVVFTIRCTVEEAVVIIYCQDLAGSTSTPSAPLGHHLSVLFFMGKNFMYLINICDGSYREDPEFTVLCCLYWSIDLKSGGPSSPSSCHKHCVSLFYQLGKRRRSK